MSALVSPTELYDCAKLARTLGISRRVAEQIIARCDKQHVPGVRKTYVRGADVQTLLDANVNTDKVTAPLRSVA